MGHSCSNPVWRDSFPTWRAASLPSPIRRRMVRSSQTQLLHHRKGYMFCYGCYDDYRRKGFNRWKREKERWMRTCIIYVQYFQFLCKKKGLTYFWYNPDGLHLSSNSVLERPSVPGRKKIKNRDDDSFDDRINSSRSRLTKNAFFLLNKVETKKSRMEAFFDLTNCSTYRSVCERVHYYYLFLLQQVVDFPLFRICVQKSLCM